MDFNQQLVKRQIEGQTLVKIDESWLNKESNEI